MGFALDHGLIISTLVSGRVCRVPTVDHPNKRNGAYAYFHDFAWLQNWAAHSSPVMWFLKDSGNVAKAVYREARKSYADERTRQHGKAQAKAKQILANCELMPHAYLEKKGFPGLHGLVSDHKLVIPMRRGQDVSGLQTVTSWGEKKFLYGQDNQCATHRIGRGRDNVLCEGYATALSLAACLKGDYSIWVCFSAGNMVKVAKQLGRGIVIADNDASDTGRKAALATGLPFFMPETTGQDLNDLWLDIGTLKTSLLLRKFVSAL